MKTQIPDSFWTDIQNNISKLRKLISKDKRILLLTHAGCLDGMGSQMVYEKLFDNIFTVKLTPLTMDEYVKNLDTRLFDAIILSDVSTTNTEFLNKHNVIMIDHHATALHLHNPEKLTFVYDFACGTKLSKMILSAVLRDPLNYMDDLVNLVNDNDLWILEDERSAKFKNCYIRLGDMDFQTKYWKFGKITFNDEDELLYKEELKELDKLCDEAEFFVSEDLSLAFMPFVGYNNVLIHELMKREKLDVFITWNPVNGKGSIRAINPLMKSGEMLDFFKIGGGHDSAAGFKLNSIEEFKAFIPIVEKYIKDNFNSLKE